MNNNFRLQILLSIFIALLIGMNLLGWKIISLFWVSTSVSIFMVPLTFLITDIVSDVYGKKEVQKFIYLWVGVLIMIFLYSAIFVYLDPNARYTSNEAYTTIFGGSLRIIVASLVAFIFWQMHDIFVFEKLKKRTKGRYLWLRNNLSTIGSQLIDSTLFMFIAFYALTPKFTVSFIISMIIPYYIFKVIFALLDTPFVYLWVKWLKDGEKN